MMMAMMIRRWISSVELGGLDEASALLSSVLIPAKLLVALKDEFLPHWD